MKKKIIFCGSGTGGHFFTSLNVYKNLQELAVKQNIEIKALFFISGLDFELEQLQKLNIKYKIISSGKWRRYFSLKNFFDIFKTFFSIIKIFFIIKKYKPIVIFGSGGYLSIPPIISGILLGIPTYIHEQTTRIGLANWLILPFSTFFYYAFSDIEKQIKRYKYKSILAGQVIKYSFKKRDEGKKIIEYFPSFDVNVPIIYVVGGSLGSKKINQILFSILPDLLRKFNIIHQYGIRENFIDNKVNEIFKEVSEKSLVNRYQKFRFINDKKLKTIYQNSALIIGRSGALTISEALYFNIPGIWIPYLHSASYEQYQNAKIYEKLGAGIIIEENELTSTFLKNKIEYFFESEKIGKMRKKLFNKKYIDAGEKIAKDILKLINR